MTQLRQRMSEDMQVRNFALNTQLSYLQQVSLFARYFSKSPDLLGREDIRTYQVYLTNEKKLAPGWSTQQLRRCAFSTPPRSNSRGSMKQSLCPSVSASCRK